MRLLSILNYYYRKTLIAFNTAYYSMKIIVLMSFRFREQLFYSCITHWALNYMKICGIRVELTGKEYLDRETSYILVANHCSELDIPVLIAALRGRNVKFIYKKELERIPIFGSGLKKSPFISITREDPRKAMESIEAAKAKFTNNSTVIVFPEGHRSETGELQQFKRGAFMLAARAGKDIVPAAIIGTYDVFPVKQRRIMSGTVKVVIAEPVKAAAASPDSRAEKELMESIRETIAASIKSAR